MEKIIRFSEMRAELTKRMDRKLEISPISGEAGFGLIQGFMLVPLNTELDEKVLIGGSCIPTVGLVGDTTGRLYTFALKALMPEK